MSPYGSPRLVCIAALWLFSAAAVRAQQTGAAGAADNVLRTGTQLVVVDVVVQDRNGHPVHGLTRENFAVTESRKPQTLRNFNEHANADAVKPGPAMPTLPPGTFTNYTPTPASGSLNVLLLDALNTPMKDQAYMRQQLQKYVHSAPAGQRVAIFALNSKLSLLQGFTSDPKTLRDAVDHKLIPRSSHLLDDAVGIGADSDSMSATMQETGLAPADVVANVQQFEAGQAALQLQMRTQYTLDAFNVLAHYLSSFPGRKNVVWFSGSFPLNILPDATLQDPFAVMQVNDVEFRETTNLLAKAQIAVYPVDARGLMVNPAFQASNSGSTLTRNPSALNAAVSNFAESQADEHNTMQQMASDTGGRAYYNTNDLTSAVADALQAGSNYYTLAYTPADREARPGYREIRVVLAGALADQGYKLYYRHGYYSDAGSPSAPPDAGPLKRRTTPPGVPDPAAVAAATYAHAAMSHGAPAPQEILFKVRVLPASAGTERTLAPGNQTDPARPLAGPYRRLAVDYAVLSSGFTLSPQPDGRQQGSFAFKVFLYDPEGRLLNTAVKTVTVQLAPAAYKRFLTGGVGMHLEISAPPKKETYLRIGVQDLASNRFGVVEIPTLEVNRLSPAPLAPPAPSTVPPESGTPLPDAASPALQTHAPAAGPASTVPSPDAPQ